jgi:CRISPR-associated protein Cas6
MPHEFQVRGAQPFSQDHGYALLAALTSRIPSLHGRHDLQVAPLRGRRTPDHKVIPDRKTRLHIRGATPDEVKALTYIGLDLNGAFLILGTPSRKELKPSPRLVSRLVILPDAVAEPDFLQSVLVALDKTLGEGAEGLDLSIGKQRAIQIKDRHLLGYPLNIRGLSDEASLTLQNRGLGWGTSMGCGVFYPGTMR